MFTVSTPGFLSFWDFLTFFFGRSLVLGGWVGFGGREGALASALIYIVVVYKVLSIYRVLPGFREIAVFEKIDRFFKLFLNFFLDWGYR